MLGKMSKKAVNLSLAAAMAVTLTGSFTPSVFAEGTSTVVENQTATLLSGLVIKDAKLNELKLNEVFSPDVKEYTAVVENNIESILIQPTLAKDSTSAKYTITDLKNQPIAANTDGSYTLNTGENTFLINVTDGSLTVTYKLSVTREKSKNNSLKTIKLSAGELSPKFSADVTDYNVQVANDISSITVAPEAEEQTETVVVNGTSLKQTGLSVKIPEGKTDISIVVTAENGEKKVYTLHVTRAAKASQPKPTKPSTPSKSESGTGKSNQFSTSARNGSSKPSGSGYDLGSKGEAKTSFGNYPSNNAQADAKFQSGAGSVQKTSKAKLSSLTVSTGTWDSSFSSDEYTYHVTVNSDIKTVTIHPTAAYSSASIKINGDSSRTITLDSDKKTIVPIVIQYSNDDRKTYVLVFDKK